MKQPEFAERQFEAAIYAELQPLAPFIPSQRIEYWLAIDAGLHPDQLHRVWNILNINIPPTGVVLGPTLWPLLPLRWHSHLPTGQLCSLFLQSKVANYQDGARCKHRAHFSGDYFETKITAHQQKALLGLEGRLTAAQAVVRYASPAFWSRIDFDAHNTHGRVLQRTSFIPPGTVGKHRKWMYDQSASMHLCNPDPEEVGAESWDALVGLLRERARSESLLEHVGRLARAIRGQAADGETVQAQWIDRLDRYLPRLNQEERSLLSYLSVVASHAVLSGTWWLILSFGDSQGSEPVVLHA